MKINQEQLISVDYITTHYGPVKMSNMTKTIKFHSTHKLIELQS